MPKVTNAGRLGARLLAGRISGVAGSLAVGQFLVGLTYVFAARSMEPARLGLVATCIAVGTLGAVVFDLGLSNFLVRDIASGKILQSDARSLVRRKRRLSPVLILPTATTCILIMPTLLEGVVLGVVGWLVWEAQTANSLLRAREQFTRAASAQVAGRAIGLVTTALLLLAIAPELALGAGIAGAFAAEAIIGRLYLGKHRTPAASIREFVVVQRRSTSFGLVSLAAAGQQLDTPLVTLGGGAAAGGIYAGAGRLLGPLLFLSSAMAFVGAPWLARTQGDAGLRRREERRILRFATVLTAAPIVAAVAGPIAIPLVLGADYTASGTAFSVLAIGAALSTLSQGIATVLQNRGQERSVARAISIGLGLGLVSTYGLAVLNGPVWAAAGFVLSQLYIAAHLAVHLLAGRRG